MIFHKGSNYDYHVFIKKSMEEFKGQFECLGENAEKYTTFSISIQKELANVKTVTCKSKFTDSVGFNASPLSNLADHLGEGFGKCLNHKSVQ